MSSVWIDERINAMYSHVRSQTLSALKSKYPKLYFTMNSAENTETKLPSVYMLFDYSERQSTLDGGVINAVYMTVRTHIKAADDSTQGDKAAREVNAKVRDELCRLGFITSGGSLPVSSSGTKEIVSNYQRVVGNDDPLII